MKRFLTTLFLAFTLSAGLAAQISEKEEEFLYSIHAYDGKEYKKTFCREESSTIYLLADDQSFLMPRKTFVYYDAALNMWRIDSQGVNEELPGRLEVTGTDNKVTYIDKTVYTYYVTPGEWDMQWKVYTGQKALDEWKTFEELREKIREEGKKFQEEMFKYRRWKEEMNKKIKEARLKGKNFEGLVQELNAKSPPPYPGRIHYELYPLEMAFIINLPVGEYRIRLLDSEGRVYENSDKKIITFSRERSNSVGFIYSATDKIKLPKQSRIPQAIIYINGKHDLYLRPYLQNEFNDFYHEKLSNNDGRGNPLSTKWIITEPLYNSWLEYHRSAEPGPEISLEEQFKVERSRENPFGYRIVYYDRNDAHKNFEPDFRSFYLPMDGKSTVIKIKVRDYKDKYYVSGEREIRVVWYTAGLVFLLILAGIPIAVYLFITIKRIILYRTAEKS
ncbi:MAG: hypothetical protein JW969_09430 [Spirochaetales bacterium]|nr:hypothetical protein [Spirochaetales bacterium]